MNQDSRQELTTQTDTIHKARRSKLLLDCTDSEIAQRLSLVYFMIGLRPQHFPTKEEDVLIFKYIRLKYGKQTIDELYLAFDLAINGNLDIDDVKVYDQFSIEYLVRIMNAYRRHASKSFENYRPEALIEEKKHVITDEEKKTDIEEMLKSNIRNIHRIPTYIFDWMVELKYINHSEEEKVNLYSRAIKHILNELKNEFQNNMANRNARIEYSNFKNRIKQNFSNITSAETNQIEMYYKKISVLDLIIKNNDNGIHQKQ